MIRPVGDMHRNRHNDYNRCIKYYFDNSFQTRAADP